MKDTGCASHKTLRKRASSILLLVLSLGAASMACANTLYKVLNVNDSGPDSLRQAILNANANVGLDTIGFAIDPTVEPNKSACSGTPAVCTITPASVLPPITSPVLIDGYTQTDASANTLDVGDDAILLIEVDGSSISGVLNVSGLGVIGGGATGSTIRGLAITHFSNYGIQVFNGANNVTIAGNFIGTDVTGTSATSTGTGINVNGAAAATNGYSSGVIIGGTSPADRNIVVASSIGIAISTATDCTIQGNYVGLDKSGEAKLVVQNGVVLAGSQYGPTSGCLVGGNRATGAGNVIVGDTNSISLTLDTNDVVQGNLIGTDASGMQSFGMAASYHGMVMGGTDDQIGGTGDGEGNLISGNRADGIVVIGSPTGTRIEGNLIGTDITGTQPLGNGWCGIDGGSASNSSVAIGGMDPHAGNIIAFNGANGVTITGANNTGWAILGNSIYDNGVLGISLSGNCQYAVGTPVDNDAGDIDTGANNLQNYPVVTTVTIDPKTTAHVSGTLNSTADSMFHIELFANASCDAKGNGEGKIFIGSTDVTTTGNDASFGLDCSVPLDRYVITATATDMNGNTSEFSVCSDQDTIFTDGLEQDDLSNPGCTPTM